MLRCGGLQRKHAWDSVGSLGLLLQIRAPPVEQSWALLAIVSYACEFMLVPNSEDSGEGIVLKVHQACDSHVLYTLAFKCIAFPSGWQLLP